MRLFIQAFCVVALLTIIGTGCKKDSLPEQHYFGGVAVTMFNLPGAPADVTMKFNGNPVGKLEMQVEKQFSLPAGVSGKLGFYEGSTDTLLMDTIVTIPKNAKISYQVAFSRETGIFGFISAPTRPVASDSIYVQFLNNLDPEKYSDAVDLEICALDFNTFETTPIGIVFEDVAYGQLSKQGFMIPLNDADGNYVYLVCKFKNRQTGEYVFQPGIGFDFNDFTRDPGHTLIEVLTSGPDGTASVSQNIYLN